MLRPLPVVVFGCAFIALLGHARAASLAVEIACAADYYAYCSEHDADSPQTRACMDRNGPNLSWVCINALIAAGEVSRTEVERRAVALKKAKKED